MAAEKGQKKKRPRFLALTGVAFQMGITIFLFAQLGKYLDEEYLIEKKYWTIGLTLAGVALSFYNLLRQGNKLNNSEGCYIKV